MRSGDKDTRFALGQCHMPVSPDMLTENTLGT